MVDDYCSMLHSMGLVKVHNTAIEKKRTKVSFNDVNYHKLDLEEIDSHYEDRSTVKSNEHVETENKFFHVCAYSNFSVDRAAKKN